MKKIIIFIVIGSFLMLIAPMVVGAKSFNDLTSYQKQKYWVYIKDCSPLLNTINKYKTCALAVLEKASQEKETNAWCTDSDGGKDFFKKGIVATDIYPQGKEDFFQTFPNGATYLMEGFCSSKNQYAYVQKKCSDFGKKYYAKDGACVYVNNPPVLANIGNKEINENQSLIFAVSASDPDKDNLTFSVGSLPAGATFENKLFSWTPTYAQAGQYNVKFIVSDGESEGSKTIVITVKNVNQPPVLSEIGNKKVSEGGELSFGIVASDSDGDALIFSAQNLPAGAVLTGNMFSWTPNYEQAGTYEVMFKVSDGKIEDSEIVVISVVDKYDKTFGGSESDRAYSIQQTNDGGYIVAGDTNSKGAGSSDAWILKLDSNGNLEWDKTYGGSKDEWVFSIQQTSNLGYIVAGETNSKGAGQLDAWILKLDSNGNLEWDKTYGGYWFDMANPIQQTSDGGYIVAGYNTSKNAGSSFDAWILKLDSNGNLEWDKTFGESDFDMAFSIQQTSDGGYIVAGGTMTILKGAGSELPTPLSEDVWIFKLDSNGILEWNKTYGEKEGDRANSIQQTVDSGYIVAGIINSKGGADSDAWILRLDSNGNLEWNKTFGGSETDSVSSIQQTSDGGYIVAGSINSKDGVGSDAWVLRLDSNGNLEWDKTFGGIKSDWASSIQQTIDGGYIVAGGTNSKGAGSSDAWILKLDSNGELEWE